MPLVFRSEAIKHLTSPEELDKSIQVVSKQAWMVLLAFYIFLIGFILWGFFGSIPTRVDGKGVLLTENGLVYTAAAPEGGGKVERILVKVGNEVKENDLLAVLERPELAEKVNLANTYVEQLEQEFKSLKDIAKKELTTRHDDIQKQETIIENALVVENKNLSEIERILKIKEEYFKKGTLMLLDLETTNRDYYSSKQKIEEYHVNLSQLKTQEADFIEQWRQRLEERELNLLSETLKRDNLRAELENSKNVLSPVDGILINIDTSVGKVIESGASVANIASLGEGLDVVVFMLPQDGQRVAPGMMALVTPANIQKEEFGSMLGEVLSVSTFPEGLEPIMAVLHNQVLTKQFLESGAPTAIRARIKRDAKTYSGYKWSSSQGPQQKVTPGMVADIRITVREQPPFSLIIPAIKKLLRIE